jgi:DNA helicase-2/ATP-dependent DNA helicase PcrA
LEYGIFPRREKTSDELEEERRLFYVGITRAMDQLYLTSARVRAMYGHLEAMEISPFLTEINPSNLDVLGNQPLSYKRFFGGNSSSLSSEDCRIYNNPLAQRWKKGATVYHDDYGNGQIVSCTLTDDEEYSITVQFETGEKKKFLPKYQQNHLMLTIQ